MIQFPLKWRTCMRIDWMGEERDVLNRKEFLGNFRKIFDAERRAEIIQCDPLEIQVERDWVGLHEVVAGLAGIPIVHVFTYSEGGEGVTQRFLFAEMNGTYRLVHCICAG